MGQTPGYLEAESELLTFNFNQSKITDVTERYDALENEELEFAVHYCCTQIPMSMYSKAVTINLFPA